MSLILLLILLVFMPKGQAQDWEKRHAFAKSYFGLSNIILPNLQNGSFLDANNSIATFGRSGFLSPAVNIGATHFWGHADLYVSINTAPIKFGDDDLENSIYMGTFTGLRVFPLKSKTNSIRPYLGYKFSPFRYKQSNISDEVFKFTQVKSVFDIGLAIQLSEFYFTLEYSRVFNPSFNSYVSKTQSVGDRFPSQMFQIGINYMIETTKSASTDANREANRVLSASNKHGLFFGIGPSSAFPMVSSNYVKDLYPFLDDIAFPIIFPDLAIGYHFTKLDLISALSFRSINQNRKAFSFEQSINRNSLILETYKFIGDYHGFVPYIGLGLSFENLNLLKQTI